jgi:hypothetical protein
MRISSPSRSRRVSGGLPRYPHLERPTAMPLAWAHSVLRSHKDWSMVLLCSMISRSSANSRHRGYAGVLNDF